MLKLRAIQDFVFLVLFIVFLASSFFAVSYLTTSDVFEAKISYINDLKLPYSIIFEIENKVYEEIEYNVEVIFKKENLVVGSTRLNCFDKCEEKIELKKIFYDEYVLEIVADYNGKKYKKELSFQLNKPESNLKLEIPKTIYLDSENLSNFSLKGNLVLDYESKVFLQAYLKENPNIRKTLEIDCNIGNCYFDLNFDKELGFGEYIIAASTYKDVITENFKIVYVNKASNKKESFNANEDTIYKFESKNFEDGTKINASDLFGNRIEIEIYNNSINTQGISNIILNENGREQDLISFENIEIESINSLKDIESKKDFTKIVTKNNKVVQEISSLKDIEKIESNIQIKSGFISFSNFNNSNSIQSDLENINPIVENETKIYYNSGKSYLEIYSEIDLKDETNKLIPGLYKQEKITRYKDGTVIKEEKFFAYGLVSINTLKPLYHKDELVNFIIVVLDKHGFLVSNSSIVFEIEKPSGDIIYLYSENYDIYEDSQGIYKTSIYSDEYGEYILRVKAKVDNIIVEIESYFNVVESYPFDILRDVPATIDPWQGPFRNDFKIIPLTNYYEEYSFTEVFSSDFEIIETDADEIETINDTTYLTWYNLSLNSNLYYVAQTPLITPYLYYLGKSYIDYNEGFERFYENRSWLFAIDPAAKTCDATSPCICGALCAGGGEPGDGTIDTCADGNTDYEYVNDIRITSYDGSYFGIGDTVEVCVDFVCETNEDITIGYKDATNTWDNTDIIYSRNGCFANYVTETHCRDVVLSNYVGYHHFRGKIVYNGNSNTICQTGTWRDHDDVEIQVLDKITPSVSSWNLDNGTDIGNNLNVIRGSLIDIFANWNLPLRSGQIRHNSTGTFVFYDVLSYSNNQTNYTFDTSNLILFPQRGIVRTNIMRAQDLYFNLTGDSVGTRDFNIIGKVKISQSKLEPSVGFSGINSTISCQVSDNNVDTNYSGVNVNFYKNGVLLGVNITNSSGWAQYSFSESLIGNYNITCNVSTDLSNYILTSQLATSTRELIVRPLGSDITIPVIYDVNTMPLVFSIGGVTTIIANVTDDNEVDLVRVYIRKPDLSLVDFVMTNIGGDIYRYIFSDTSLDGNYEYYIYALDNSSNPAYSSTKNFQVTGVRSFIGIQSSQSIFKLGQSLNLNNFSKTQNVASSVYNEEGDVSYIYYSFDSSDEGWTHGGNQDEWERGVPTDADLNTCENGNCWATDLNANYNNNANNWIQSPIINMDGRTNSKVSFWREIRMPNTLNDRVYFESYDGSTWNILYQNSIGANNQEGAFYTYYPSEVEGVSNSRFRFRMTSDGGTNDEGFVFDSFNLSFNGNVDWAKSWNQITSSFGSDVTKLSAIKIGFNITSYDSSGSDIAGTASPDIELQIYDGTSYTGNYKCNLDSTKSYPYYCEFIIKNNDVYFDAWNLATNRNIQFRAIGLDSGDSITWTDIKREYITPSIIENNGIGTMSAYLLEQFKNSTGGIVSTLHFAPISINPGEARQLSDFWTYAISGNFQLGNYSAYVALTDAFGNVLQNEDDGSYINDSYGFEIRSLIINPIIPRWNDLLNESFTLNLTLDTSSYGAGGWCGYSLNGALNVSMTQISLINYIFPFTNQLDGSYNITFYCNDSDGDFVDTGKINYNVSVPPKVNYISPTDNHNDYVDRSYTIINVSINDTTFHSSWLEWNGINESITNCFNTSVLNHFCSINKSNLLNGLYQYRVCANDSLKNIGCSNYRNINIDKTLPQITVNSPIDNWKYLLTDAIYTNASLDTSSLFVDKIWIEFNSNSTKYFLTNTSYFDWDNNFMLQTGYYSVKFYGNDTIGNIFNSSTYNFIVIPDKNIKTLKNITNIGYKSYNVLINITNYGNHQDYIFYDFIDSNFNYYDLSLINSGSSGVAGVYAGDLLTWNLTLAPFTSQIISYKINGSLDYNLINNYIFGID